jgi:hypothetical protein
MEEIKIKGKALYSTKGAAREYGRIGCNFYVGCPHGCTYCYLKRGALSKYLGGTEVKLKKCFKDEEYAAKVFLEELAKWWQPCQKYGIFLSFTTDPLIEETRSLTGFAVREAAIRGVPVYILTKNATFFDDEVFRNYVFSVPYYIRASIHFGFTLTGRDDMEPNASTNEERICAMRDMASLGFSTFASIEPVIDWQSAWRVVKMSLPWCDHYKIGLRSGVKKDYYAAVQSYYVIETIVRRIEGKGKTVYLKESTRKLLQRTLQPDAYEAFLSHTVDMDGKKINI